VWTYVTSRKNTSHINIIHLNNTYYRRCHTEEVDVAGAEEEVVTRAEEHQEEEDGMVVVVVGDLGMTDLGLTANLMVQSLTFSYVLITRATKVANGAIVAITNMSSKCTRLL
jgi:hypothetical protein